jgi:hypothetical protein
MLVFFPPFFTFFLLSVLLSFLLLSKWFLFLSSFVFPLLFQHCFIPVSLAHVVSSLPYPNLLGTKRLGCWLPRTGRELTIHVIAQSLGFIQLIFLLHQYQHLYASISVYQICALPNKVWIKLLISVTQEWPQTGMLWVTERDKQTDYHLSNIIIKTSIVSNILRINKLFTLCCCLRSNFMLRHS